MVGFNLNSSTVSTIYLVLLGVFFLIMIVMTVTLIVSRNKRDDEDDIEDFDDAEDEALSEAAEMDSAEQPFGDSAFFEDDTISDDSYVNTFDELKTNDAVQKSDDIKESAQAEQVSEKIVRSEQEEKSSVGEITEEAAQSVQEEITTGTVQSVQEEITTGTVQSVQEQMTPEFAQPVKEETLSAKQEQTSKTGGVQDAPEAGTDDWKSVSEEHISEKDSALEELPENLFDSAFAPEPEETGLTNEALNASVKEAVALGAAVSGMASGLTASSMFGIRDELDKGSRKKTQSKSTVPSTDDFYWYNKMDVAEKPSYKTAEMYYHYFNIAKDCIEDLLIEMYDCALVRTEEIRYIAYGIEPRAVSIREILTSGNHNYVQHQKLKEPTTQDLVRIYEKWCGYVDKLFEKVEIHADAFTIDEIRRLLYDYGRNDVDVLLEGK